MPNFCAVVLNSARARYFVLRDGHDPYLESGPELVEEKVLANPEATLPERSLFANLRGSNRSHAGGSEHNYDDHRAEHVDQLTRRFAKDLVGQAGKFLRDQQGDVLVVVANPSMLGQVRPLLASHAKLSAKVVECAKDLSTQPSRAIHESLASEGLLPARSEPSHTRNGRRR